MNLLATKPVLALLVLGASLCAALMYRAALHAEQASHATTKTHLAQAVADGTSWKNAAGEKDRRTQAVQHLASQCLERERTAQAEAATWQEVLSNAAQVSMNPTQQQQVPDHATRQKLFQSLDAPL